MKLLHVNYVKLE